MNIFTTVYESIPRWKLRILRCIANLLGLLIHVNGAPFGSYGSNQYSNQDLDVDD